MARKWSRTAKLIQTLVFYDGPQVALFDTDAEMKMLAVAIGEAGPENMFFGAEVTQKVFRAYKDGRIDLNFLFRYSTGRRHYVFSWSAMDDAGNVKLRRALQDEIANPDNYPERGFFEENHTEAWLTAAPEAAKQRFDIAGRWEANDFSRFYTKIGDVYSFLSIVEDLESDDIAPSERREIHEALTGPTWKGGGSYVGFYADIADHAQDIRPLRVTGIVYHSPGHIEVEGRSSVFDELNEVVFAFQKNEEAIKTIYSALGSLLTKEDVRASDKNKEFSSPTIRDVAHKHTTALALALQLDNPETLLRACGGNVAIFAKVMMSYYRRIRDLYAFQREGRLTIALSNDASASTKGSASPSA